MELHRGRLIDHIQLRCADLAASKRFYAAALAVLGRELIELAPHLIIADELCLTPASRDQVVRFHAAALAAGGRDNGAPGERPYHPGYYAAFVLDPDGNNIEAVHHGEATRSAASVVITATMPGH